jgi:hypothetical protein
MRHTFHLLAVTVQINPKKPREARVDFHCREDAFHFLMPRETLETVQEHIAEALTKAPLHAERTPKAANPE